MRKNTIYENAIIMAIDLVDSNHNLLIEELNELTLLSDTAGFKIVDTIEKPVSDSSDIQGFPISKKHKRDLLQYMTSTNVKVEGSKLILSGPIINFPETRVFLKSLRY